MRRLSGFPVRAVGKKNLLNFRALLFYEKDCIISSRVSRGLLNDPISENVFQSKHTFQQSLPGRGTATQDCQQSGTVLASLLLLFLVAFLGGQNC